MHIFGTGDWADYFMIGMALLVLSAIVLVILYAAFYSVDYAFGRTHETFCTVEDVFPTAEHAEVFYNVILKIPSLRVIPDHWQLDIRTPFGVDDFRLRKPPGPEYQKGCKVMAGYRVGGITKTAIVIHWVSPVQEHNGQDSRAHPFHQRFRRELVRPACGVESSE